MQNMMMPSSTSQPGATGSPSKMPQIYKIFFLAIAFIGCFTSFSRADFNLPLFAFAWFLWDNPVVLLQIMKK